MINIMDIVEARDPFQSEFHQAVGEVAVSVQTVLDKVSIYRKEKILERMVEPERMIAFRVPWMDDKGEIHVNRGYRVEMNSALGPYKGGLRFHPSVTLSTLKFLAFEQVLKNALTTLPMGGGKGGADFDPKGKSDREIMNFCQSFMSELHRHIGPHTDIPAGDIGVGAREIGYLFGMYKKMSNEFTCILTGKGINWGGSLIRPEATGYGAIYFAAEMLATRSDSLEGKTCIISGSGNVATYAAQKLIEMNAKVVTLSDSGGHIYDEEGLTEAKLAYVMDLKNVKRGRISEYAEKYKNALYIPYKEGKNTPDYNKIWDHKADCAFPCATQNEINEKDAGNLIKNGVFLISEGANMPSYPEAIQIYHDNKVLYGLGKAANAGGVAVSGLEMTQNSIRMYWTREEVDHKLRNIMSRIHRTCLDAAEEYGMSGNYEAGANIAGFVKVADAMIDQGVV